MVKEGETEGVINEWCFFGQALGQKPKRGGGGERETTTNNSRIKLNSPETMHGPLWYCWVKNGEILECQGE